MRDGPLRALVVDDAPSIVELVRLALEADGCWVEAVSVGHAALQTVRAAQSDVLLLDVMLPGLDGLDIRT